MISDEQEKQIKQQIIQQIKSIFPEEKQDSAKQQILDMNKEQLLEFLKQNNAMQKDNQNQANSSQCIFCSIVSGDTPSYKIDENLSSIAVLEINPISKAHIIIIPKEHIPSKEKIPPQCFSLANQIAEKIKSKLKPKEVLIETRNMFGHELIDIIPVYKSENKDSQKYKAEEKELLEMQKLLQTKPKLEIIKKPHAEKISQEKIRLPKRIP